MRSINRAELLGRVGQDPEVRSTGNGKRVAQFSLATSWKPKQGDEVTQWHRVIVWEALADLAEQYIRKGDPLYCSGEIQYRQYQDKDGVTKYTTEIVAREIILLGSKDGERREPARAAAPARSTGYEDFHAPALEDDGLDLPF